MSRIAVAPFGLVRPEATARLAPALGDAFAREIVYGPLVRIPAPAYERTRRQYRSSGLLDALAAIRRPEWEWERLLGVADVHLYAPGLNFVFGEADPARGVAVISLWRLRSPGRVEDARFWERAVKEAIHELGHTYGLEHCGDPACVMWFSRTLGETDRKRRAFCAAHRAALSTGAHPGPEAVR